MIYMEKRRTFYNEFTQQNFTYKNMLIPVFVLTFFLDGILPFNYGISAIIFVIASCTDFIDGHIARSRGLVTNLGKFLDPIADKVLVLTALILMLTNVNGGVLGAIEGGISVAIILARELIVSSFRMVAASKNMVIAADKLGKIKTISQDIALVMLMFGKSFEGAFFNIVFWVGYGLFMFSVLMTIISGINYIWKNRAVLKD